MEEPTVYLDTYYNFHVKEAITVNDLVSDEIRSFVSPHWLNFPPSHPFIGDFISLFYAFLCTISISCNLFFIYLYVKDQSLKTPSNLLLMNLAVTEIMLMMTNGFPICILPFFNNYWAYGSSYCTFYGFCGAVTGGVTIFTLVAIGYDRYHSITSKYQTSAFTFTKACLVILAIWIYALAINLPPALGIWSHMALEGLLLTCSFEYTTDTFENKSYVLFLTITSFLLPLILIFYFYILIIKTVHNYHKKVKSCNNSMIALAYSNSVSSEAKIHTIAITSVMLWVLAWTPYAVVVLIGQFGSRQLVTPLVSQLPSISAKTFTALNSVAIGLSHPHFSRAAKEKQEFYART